MAIESLILFGLLVGAPQRPRKQVEPGDTETAQKEEDKQKQAQGLARGGMGAYKGKKLADKLNFGKKGQGGMAVAGALGGRLLGRRKAENREENNQAEGHVQKRSRVNRTGRAVTKELAKEGVKMGIEKLGALGGPIGIVVAKAVIHYRISLSILLVIVLLILMFFFDAQVLDPPQVDTGQPVTSDSCNPGQFSGSAFGQTSVCTISVQYYGSADDITITDTILPGTAFVSTGEGGTYDKSSNTVTWDAQKLGFQLNPINITVTVTVRITTKQNNVKVWNAYEIAPVNLSGSTATSNTGGGAAIPGNIPPSTNDCSGIYAHYMGITPGHQNYGDPSCSLIKKDANGVAFINKDAILSELKTLKPSEAMGWFICVVPNESGYNANAYLGASTSGNGAYGLVQMNPTGKGNGKYDNGQVVWPLQLSNGINYNDNVIGHAFSYWPTSYDSCLRSYGVSVP